MIKDIFTIAEVVLILMFVIIISCQFIMAEKKCQADRKRFREEFEEKVETAYSEKVKDQLRYEKTNIQILDDLTLLFEVRGNYLKTLLESKFDKNELSYDVFIEKLNNLEDLFYDTKLSASFLHIYKDNEISEKRNLYYKNVERMKFILESMDTMIEEFLKKKEQQNEKNAALEEFCRLANGVKNYD